MDSVNVRLIAGMELRSQHEGRLPQMIGAFDINQLLSRKACNSAKVSINHSQMQECLAAVILLIDLGPRILQEHFQNLILLVFQSHQEWLLDFLILTVELNIFAVEQLSYDRHPALRDGHRQRSLTVSIASRSTKVIILQQEIDCCVILRLHGKHQGRVSSMYLVDIHGARAEVLLERTRLGKLLLQ